MITLCLITHYLLSYHLLLDRTIVTSYDTYTLTISLSTDYLHCMF